MNFSDFIKSTRLDSQLTLREFCRQLNMDPSNWSKVERGVSPPPADAEFLKRLAGVLSLDADAIQQLHDLAAIARGQIPADLQQEQILAKMPAFFRAIRGQEYDENDLREMIQDVRKLHQPGN